ncbi:MAG: murein L,D-transpeptidase catalytic domain family protein [Ferruginibacter sp.]
MKNTYLRKVHVFFSSLLILMIHIPFSFAKLKDKAPKRRPVAATHATHASAETSVKVRSERSLIYDSLKLNILGLSQKAFDYAIDGLDKLKRAGKIVNDQVISIVDFTKSSAEKRLFVIDLEHQQLLFNTYVAHGQNSGKEFASRFSNSPSSYQSSLGFYETTETYNGSNGYSLHLTGLERGVNDKADERAIVMHGAAYVSEGYKKMKGYMGRSWGCPAVPEKLAKPIIDKIKNGTCLFIYSPNKKYLKRSKILNS